MSVLRWVDRRQLHPTLVATPVVVLLGDGVESEEYPAHRVLFVDAAGVSAVDVAGLLEELSVDGAVLLRVGSGG